MNIGEHLAICNPQALINTTASPSTGSAGQGAMYAPLALKSVYGKQVSSSRHRLTYSQSTRPDSQSHDNWDTQGDTVKTTQTRGFRGCHRWRCGWRCGFTRDRDHCPGSMASTKTKLWTHLFWVLIFERIHRPGHTGHSDAIQPHNVNTYRGPTAGRRDPDGFPATVVRPPVFPGGLTTPIATYGVCSCSCWFVRQRACAAPLTRITFPTHGRTTTRSASS